MRGLITAALLGGAGLFTGGQLEAADGPATSEPRPGVSVGVFGSRFFGYSQSGPTTPISDTRYQDTFEPGSGARLDAGLDLNETLRGVAGIVHSRWGGKYFRGGEFPAGARFGDLGLTAVYLGARLRFLPGASVRPYVLGNLGIAQLSAVTVDRGSGASPYWKNTFRDYLEFGGGLEYPVADRFSLTADLRIQVFGKPDSAAGLISEGTGGVALVGQVGFDVRW